MEVLLLSLHPCSTGRMEVQGNSTPNFSSEGCSHDKGFWKLQNGQPYLYYKTCKYLQQQERGVVKKVYPFVWEEQTYVFPFVGNSLNSKQTDIYLVEKA